MDSTNLQPFDAIVLSGGGTRALAQLGALQHFYELNLIANVTEYAGTSAGSILCFLLACGFSPMDIMYKVSGYDFIQLFHNAESPLDISIEATKDRLGNIATNFGFLSLTQLIKILDDVTLAKYGYHPTFLGMYQEYGIKITITTVNLSKSQVEYFNYETHPYTKITDAIRLSCTIPFLFEKADFEESTYVDGGIADNFPYEKITKGLNTLGIVILNDYSKDMPLDSFLGYAFRNIMFPIQFITKEKIKCVHENMTLLTLDIQSNLIGFSMSTKEKLNVFMEGFIFAKEITNKK